jgi:bifunctional NMN adenylyltransferase/nudix hydrolase
MERKFVKADVGVVIGRFQVDQLHPGHRELLDWVCSHHQKVVVILGIPAAPGMRDNPLDYEARAAMIREAYPQAITAFVTDYRSDEAWSIVLDSVLGGLLSPGQSAVLYGSRSSFISHYNGKFQTQELVGEGEFWSGTQVRDRIRVQVKPTADFRAGVIWSSMNRYPTVYATVDIAILKSSMVKRLNCCQNEICVQERFVLLARKRDDPPGTHRFIGGFADTKSRSYEEDAAREVLEETGLEVGKMEYVCNRKIDDWRYRGEGDVVRSTFFTTEYSFGAPKAMDDIDSLDWFELRMLKEKDIVPEHREFFRMLMEKEYLPFCEPPSPPPEKSSQKPA